MTTEVVITGIGCPIPTAGNAGPGVLVRYRPSDGGDPVQLQFDAGRSTVMRLMGASCPPWELDAVFLTHHHSDHCTGLQDLVLTRWVMDMSADGLPALPILCPEGPAAEFVSRMLDAWDNDLAVRQQHAGRSDGAAPDLRAFPVPASPGPPTVVHRVGEVTVSAGQVRHEPVEAAVGYRIETPDGVVAITGDTLVCDEVAALAEGADVLVYEALRFGLYAESAASRFILDYHADTKLIGAQARALETPHLVLTHLIPQPRSPEEEQGFADDVRAGGFEGELTVARDLTTIVLD